VVKTLESPRDLQVPPEITQYSPLEGSMEASADILLLVRPDYTIYDEVRKTRDFQVFADMRLAGVGMIGVVHANKPIDALQRLLGRVELGMIPQVVDTVVFIERGEVTKVLDVEFVVKVPSGMVEADLARPVIVVKDFESGQAEYEVYSYGEQIVVMPVTREERKPSWNLASREIEREISHHVRGPFKVEMLTDSSAVIHVPQEDAARVIGKAGKNIDQIERSLGMHIDVRARDEPSVPEPRMEETAKHIILWLDGMAGESVDVSVGDEPAFTATVGRRGDIRIAKSSEMAKRIIKKMKKGESIEVHRSGSEWDG
jgi:ATPase